MSDQNNIYLRSVNIFTNNTSKKYIYTYFYTRTCL